MNRASPVEMRKSLALVETLKQGNAALNLRSQAIYFVPGVPRDVKPVESPLSGELLCSFVPRHDSVKQELKLNKLKLPLKVYLKQEFLKITPPAVSKNKKGTVKC